MNNTEMFQIVREQLAIDYNCMPDDFLKEGLLFTKAVPLKGRRALPFGSARCEMITMGHGIIVNASEDVLPFVKKRLQGKSKYDVMHAPFLVGVNPYYLPDLKQTVQVETNNIYQFLLVERPDIQKYYKIPGLTNALQYNTDSLRPDSLAVAAFEGQTFAGIACASADCKTMWQIGVDVLPAYRGHGIATAMVWRLTQELLERGIIPYYSTDSTNVASQKTAISAGYIPAWSHGFRNRLKGRPHLMINYLRY